jgi:DNA-directed RNA polymerase specialized sigma subunit
MTEVPVRKLDAVTRAKRAGRQLSALQDQMLVLSMIRREAVQEMTRTMTYREIGAELGISSPRVSQILGTGWKKSRKEASA